MLVIGERPAWRSHDQGASGKVVVSLYCGSLMATAERMSVVVMRTVKLELVLTEQQKGSLLRTMEEYTQRITTPHHGASKTRSARRGGSSTSIYYPMREAVPKLGAGLIQSAKDTACEALKRNKMRYAPRRRPHAAVRYSLEGSQGVFRVWNGEHIFGRGKDPCPRHPV